MKKTLSLISFALLISATTVAQNNNQPELDSGTIESQFDYIITKSSSFKEFQLIRKASILKVKKNTLDSLKNIQSDLATVQQSIAPLKNEIKQLQSEVIALKGEIEATAHDKDSITVAGKQLSKSSYNTFVWSLVALLVLALLFFIYQFKNSLSTTKKSKSSVEKIEHELEDFKKKSMKKEQELMRKLQDELNKNTQG